MKAASLNSAPFYQMKNIQKNIQYMYFKHYMWSYGARARNVAMRSLWDCIFIYVKEFFRMIIQQKCPWNKSSKVGVEPLIENDRISLKSRIFLFSKGTPPVLHESKGVLCTLGKQLLVFLSLSRVWGGKDLGLETTNSLCYKLGAWSLKDLCFPMKEAMELHYGKCSAVFVKLKLSYLSFCYTDCEHFLSPPTSCNTLAL